MTNTSPERIEFLKEEIRWQQRVLCCGDNLSKERAEILLMDLTKELEDIESERAMKKFSFKSKEAFNWYVALGIVFVLSLISHFH